MGKARHETLFPDAATANAALQAFFTDVAAAAKTHGIPNVLAVACVETTYEDGERGQGMCLLPIGDELLTVPMAAWALGQASADARERIAKLVRGGRK